MTRAEIKKRNYALIRNTYMRPDLAKSAQGWSDKRLYDELGIKVTKRTPKLKPVKASSKNYYNRKLEKFLYARGQGLDPFDAKKLTPYSNKKIASTSRYKEIKTKKFTASNKEKRIDMWAKWSENDNRDMPPEIKKFAIEINRNTKIRKRTLDDTDSYGYVVAYYIFVENQNEEIVKETVKPDPFDSYRILYPEDVIAT